MGINYPVYLNSAPPLTEEQKKELRALKMQEYRFREFVAGYNDYFNKEYNKLSSIANECRYSDFSVSLFEFISNLNLSIADIISRQDLSSYNINRLLKEVKYLKRTNKRKAESLIEFATNTCGWSI